MNVFSFLAHGFSHEPEDPPCTVIYLERLHCFAGLPSLAEEPWKIFILALAERLRMGWLAYQHALSTPRFAPTAHISIKIDGRWQLVSSVRELVSPRLVECRRRWKWKRGLDPKSRSLAESEQTKGCASRSGLAAGKAAPSHQIAAWHRPEPIFGLTLSYCPKDCISPLFPVTSSSRRVWASRFSQLASVLVAVVPAGFQKREGFLSPDFLVACSQGPADEMRASQGSSAGSRPVSRVRQRRWMGS